MEVWWLRQALLLTLPHVWPGETSGPAAGSAAACGPPCGPPLLLRGGGGRRQDGGLGGVRGGVCQGRGAGEGA